LISSRNTASQEEGEEEEEAEAEAEESAACAQGCRNQRASGPAPAAAAAAASLLLLRSHTYSQRASSAESRYSGLVELEKESSSGGRVEEEERPAASLSAAFSSMVFPLPGGPQRMKGVRAASQRESRQVTRSVSWVAMTSELSSTAEGGKGAAPAPAACSWLLQARQLMLCCSGSSR